MWAQWVDAAAWAAWWARATTRATCAARLATAVVRAWLRAWGLAAAAPSREARLHKVYAFNDDDSQGFYREIPVHLFDPGAWESSVRDATGWTDFRAEVRYTYRHKKYRMVLRRGDRCTFPPYAEPSGPTCRLPKGVLSARLQGPLGSDIDCDVTRRVLKYQGPRGDFHAGLGLRVRLHDMFPFDDHADNAARFTHLRVLDTMARVRDVSYGANPDMAGKA